jgi:hypothetical protein
MKSLGICCHIVYVRGRTGIHRDYCSSAVQGLEDHTSPFKTMRYVTLCHGSRAVPRELLTLGISVIHSVSVASQPADFVHNDPLASLSVSNPTDCHTHAELKRKVYSALAEGDEGELSIAVPKEAIIRQSGGVSGGFASEGV